LPHPTWKLTEGISSDGLVPGNVIGTGDDDNRTLQLLFSRSCTLSEYFGSVVQTYSTGLFTKT